jgi:hypothetical protein
MPIRKEMRGFYGAAWRRKRRQALRFRGDNLCCDNCRHPHDRLNWCHLSGHPTIPGDMAFFCPSCHAIHDTPYRIAASRRTRARAVGQLWLSTEIELAPLAPRFRPDQSHRQMSLFAEAI